MADRRSARMGRWALGALILLSGAGCTPLDDLLANIAVQRSMRWQPSVQAYESQPLLPPEGSVPFAAGNFPQAPGVVNLGQPEVAMIPAPMETLDMLTQSTEATGTENPVPSTPASLARGEVMFDRACFPCHGSAGAGDGPISAAGVPAFSLLTEQAIALTDGFIYNMIRYGRGGMPSYGHQITHYDRWHLVNYVRQLQAQAGAQAAPAAGQ